MPPGVAGELHIGGAGLARGYLNRPELTAEKFIANPFSEDPGSRLYKTGDLCRWLPEGNLEFLGRRDDQVKLRGYRIELSEIEAILTEHADIQSCIVVLNEDSTDRQLTAYVVPVEEAQPTPRQLQNYLGQRLPNYMLPVAYIILDTLPLTPNGKVDRRSLPAPVRANIAVSSDLQAPKDALEMQLAQIWEDVLNVQRIGVDDDFFDLGGHSLLAVNLISRIEKLTGKKPPLSTLFQAPSVRCLANILRADNWDPRWNSLVPVQPDGSRTPLFLVPPAASTSMRFVTLSRYLGNDQPVYGFDLIGDDDQEIPLDRVEDIAAQFVHQLVMQQPRGPYLVGGMCFGAHVAFEMAQQLGRQGRQATVLVIDVSAPYNGPYWRSSITHRRRGIPRIIQLISCAIYHLRHGNFVIELNAKIARELGPLMKLTKGRAVEQSQQQALYQCQRRAQYNYCAQPFLGNVAIFQSAEYNGREEISERWASLVLGSFSRFVIPATSHRSLLKKERGIRRLAEKIQCFLEEHPLV